MEGERVVLSKVMGEWGAGVSDFGPIMMISVLSLFKWRTFFRIQDLISDMQLDRKEREEVEMVLVGMYSWMSLA